MVVTSQTTSGLPPINARTMLTADVVFDRMAVKNVAREGKSPTGAAEAALALDDRLRTHNLPGSHTADLVVASVPPGKIKYTAGGDPLLPAARPERPEQGQGTGPSRGLF